MNSRLSVAVLFVFLIFLVHNAAGGISGILSEIVRMAQAVTMESDRQTIATFLEQQGYSPVSSGFNDIKCCYCAALAGTYINCWGREACTGIGCDQQSSEGMCNNAGDCPCNPQCTPNEKCDKGVCVPKTTTTTITTTTIQDYIPCSSNEDCLTTPDASFCCANNLECGWCEGGKCMELEGGGTGKGPYGAYRCSTKCGAECNTPEGCYGVKQCKLVGTGGNRGCWLLCIKGQCGATCSTYPENTGCNEGYTCGRNTCKCTQAAVRCAICPHNNIGSAGGIEYICDGGSLVKCVWPEEGAEDTNPTCEWEECDFGCENSACKLPPMPCAENPNAPGCPGAA